MGPVATGLGEVFHYLATPKGVARAKLTEKERIEKLTHLRTVQDWVIKPAMRTVPGNAEINGWGGYEKQYQVRIDPRQTASPPSFLRSGGAGGTRATTSRPAAATSSRPAPCT